MSKLFFLKLKNNIFKYFLEFFSFQEKIFLLQINKKFKELLQESNNMIYYHNVTKSLKHYSFPKLLSNNSIKIEEFLSYELRRKKVNDENEWNQLQEVVLYFLSKKFMKNFYETNNVIKLGGNFERDKITLFNEKKKFDHIYFPCENQLRAQFYLKKSIKACDINQINLYIENSIINKKSGKCLAKLLNKNKIQKLSINNCHITRNGIFEFLRILQEKELTINSDFNRIKLKNFEIRFCYLKDRHIGKILRNLASKNFYEIEILDLSCNNVGKETLLALNENSKIFKFKKLKMKKCNFLEPIAFPLLCKYIIENHYLTHLSLLCCNFNEKSFLLLIRILNTDLIILESLGLSIKNFSKETFDNFSNAINNYKKLKTLRLTICNFSLYGLSCISHILSNSECSLAKLELNQIDFKFSFSKNFNIFINSLMINTSLRSLSFTECYFSNEQINLIFNVVFYKRIQKFEIINFKFSLTQDLLPKLKFIKKFSFSNNDFTHTDLKEFIISMKDKNFLNVEIIDLSYNPFLFPDLLADELIFQIISNCLNLKKINLKNNFIQHNEQEKIRNLCKLLNREIFFEF